MRQFEVRNLLYFTWDKNKARANIRKHGIDFDTDSLVFRDLFSVRKLDRITAEVKSVQVKATP